MKLLVVSEWGNYSSTVRAENKKSLIEAKYIVWAAVWALVVSTTHSGHRKIVILC